MTFSHPQREEGQKKEAPAIPEANTLHHTTAVACRGNTLQQLQHTTTCSNTPQEETGVPEGIPQGVPRGVSEGVSEEPCSTGRGSSIASASASASAQVGKGLQGQRGSGRDREGGVVLPLPTPPHLLRDELPDEQRMRRHDEEGGGNLCPPSLMAGSRTHDQLREWAVSLLQRMECPCCMESMGSGGIPIYVFNNCGHLFCNRSNCSSYSASACPLCKEAVTTRTRSFFPFTDVLTELQLLTNDEPPPSYTTPHTPHSHARAGASATPRMPTPFSVAHAHTQTHTVIESAVELTSGGHLSSTFSRLAHTAPADAHTDLDTDARAHARANANVETGGLVEADAMAQADETVGVGSAGGGVGVDGATGSRATRPHLNPTHLASAADARPHTLLTA
eukprot:CAMPEP_0173078348 /NCGR_PEP_ID=MMETSP1102-20130122/14046_1 /TAXON_ID=49646 /ORGANISM="Geminigera sp., Strain Caron Lab Isolate" /LENGTH=392 /DNA_ID=CAMNT_0013949565 /DNA_START=64 /DNA_END=1239 /DNA_ORIENTATION=-